ncbi:MAG TPA: transporter substrate-binding domain-containing protein [Ardenticatenaceae bacterium]|nr:transporter substrate-binding domain-containing protein [Ardenticatenaceae bacterium]
MRILWTVLLMLALLLSACGGGAVTTPTTAPQEEAPAAPEVPQDIGAAATEAPQETEAPEATEPAQDAEAPATGEVPDLGGREIRIGSDTAYPPFESVDENNEIVGFDVDMMNAVCELANCQATFITAPFDGIFAALAAAEYDAVVSAVTITAERDEIVDFSRPYLNAGQIVTVRADTEDIAGPEDLQGRTVGVQLGTTGDIAASDYTDEENIQRFETIDLAMVSLAQGDIDAVIADAPTSGDIVAKQFEGELKLVGEPFTNEYYGIAVREDTPELKEAFDAALAQLSENGQLAEIAEQWGIPAAATQNLPESGLEQ